MSKPPNSWPRAARRHVRIVGVVSAAHFVSHYYILLLPPLLPFVRADYGVSYTEIGFAFAAFNVVSAALQTPAGFLVDWLGARILLIGGLVIGAAAFTVAGAHRLVLADGGDVRARRRRQHGLSPRRLRDAVAPCAGRPHRPGLLDPHLRRHAGLGGGAGESADDAEPVGLARRFRRRRRSRLCGGGAAHGDARHRRGQAEPACARHRLAATPRSAGGCCCRRRSCSILFSLCCSR